MSRRGDAVERAWRAYEDGLHEEALAEIAEVASDDPRRWLLEALARTELGELDRARAAIARLTTLEAFERDPDCQWAVARLALREWRIADARRTLSLLAELDPTCEVHECLALCAEIEGRFDRAKEHLVEAARVAPADWTPPPCLSAEAFASVVQQAVERLPEAFREALADTEVIVEPAPYLELIDRSDPVGTPPDMLGLFVGPSGAEREDGALDLPPRIYLFQHNLERAALDEPHLVEEIHVTLYHELGHLLGLDEQDVADLGLE